MFSRIRSNKNKLNWLWPWIIIALISLIILLPQIMNHGMLIGEDCWFHMNRSYETMEQLKTGHLSYFLNLFSFSSSGRIVNGLYGPLGGYLEGLLLLSVRTWYRWELLNSFIVLMVSGISMYYVARKLNNSFWLSILVGIFYMSSFPFNRWVISQNFDGFGAMLLPWFLLAGYRIFKHDLNPIKLALLVAIMSQIHLMSTMIGLMILFVGFILANCYPGRWQVWINTIKAAGLGLLLTINIWGALLEVKDGNHLIPPVPYFGFLSVGHAIHGSMIIQPVVNHMVTELVLFLVLSLIWIVLRHVNVIAKFMAIQSLFFFWLSSKYFPWLLLLKHQSMVASYIQFPERFLPVAIASLLLLIIQLKPKIIMGILLPILVVINIGFDIQYEQNSINYQYHALMRKSSDVMLKRPVSFQHLENTLHSDNLKSFITLTTNHVPDYLPSKVIINQSYKYFRLKPDVKNINQIINNRINIKRSVMGRDVEKLKFDAQPNRKITLPFVKYNHTELYLNHHLIKPELSQINAIKIRPTQQRNVLEAQYQPSRWYEVLTLVEIVAWLSIFVDWILKYHLSRRL